VHIFRLELGCCLDLCAGSGIQGLMALRLGLTKAVLGVEINARAVRFARANATMNGYGSQAFYYVSECSTSWRLHYSNFEQAICQTNAEA